MILFAIPKTPRKNPETQLNEYIVDESDYFDIPIVYPIDLSNPNAPNKISEYNIQLISWNQAINPITKSEIKNTTELFQAILDCARQDNICKSMVSQFIKLYNPAVNIIDNFYSFITTYQSAPRPNENEIPIFRTIFEYWPHPMIGNIINCFSSRPQTYEKQYEANWNSIKASYMSANTKKIIDTLFKNLETDTVKAGDVSINGLKELEKSGRDQCRICKDWTELARAVIGEISSYLSKLLEKIYALEVCLSKKIVKGQAKLLKKFVEYDKFYYPDTPERTYYKLEDLFTLGKIQLNRTEYIFQYFHEELKDIKESKTQWYALASFINNIDSLNPPIIPNIDLDSIDHDDRTKIKQMIRQSKKLPPAMRYAMVFNIIRRFPAKEVTAIEKKSITIDQNLNTTDFFSICKIESVKNQSCLPAIKRDGDRDATRLSGWMRDEYHSTTITNRLFLMPLWAGPSSHANEILAHFFAYFPTEGFFNLANTLLPPLFAFWRLYYDKRISAVHTLAETCDAVFYGTTNTESPWKKFFTENMYNVVNTTLEKDSNRGNDITYDDPWDALLYKDLNVITSSVGLMFRIYKKYYKPELTLSENIQKLKQDINTLKSQLINQKYSVIEWSKNIIYTNKKTKTKTTYFMEKNLSIATRKDFPRVSLVVTPSPSPTQQASSTPQNFKLSLSEEQEQKRIAFLHGLIDQSKNSFKFKSNKDYRINPPQCLTDNGLQEFIGAMEFKDINFTTKFDETDTSFTFTADVDTSSDCWSCIKSTIPGLKSTENISCTVTDTEAQDSLLFHGEIRLDGQSITLRNASISLDKLVIESGLDSDGISCSIEASIKKNNQVSNDDTFKITIYHPLYSASINICGQYEDENKVVTIPKLVDLFGLDKIAPSSILPADENIFGTLGLQSLEINLERNAKAESETEAKSESDPFKITKLQFVISTEKKWSIFKNEKKEDLISLKPYFEIDIDSPFDDKKRNLFCSATGEWTLKGKNDDEDTKFYVTLTSYKTIYAGLAEGSTLHLDNVINLFAPEKKDLFPTDIKFTDLSLMADFDSSNYSLSIAAEDVYKFKAGNKEFSINGLSCYLDFWNGNFGELKLGGQFKLGPIDLNLYGTFSGNKAFSFTAEAFNDQEYCIGDFIHDVSTQLNCSEITPPDEIKEAYIRNLYVSYNSTGNEFVAKIDIEKVFEFKNYFSIDDLKFKISTTTSTQPKEQQPNERQSDEVKSNETSTFNFQICAYISICEKSLELGLDYDSNEKKCTFKGSVNELDITTEKLLKLFGIDAEPFPKFIRDFKIEGIEATIVHQAENKDANQEEQNSFDLTLKTNAGTLIISVESGKETTWKIIYTTKDEHEKELVNIDILELPVAGELVKKINPDISNTTINNFKIEASSKKGVNLLLSCNAFGQDFNLEVPLSKPKDNSKSNSKQVMLLKNDNSSGPAFKGTVVWKRFDKPLTILILSIPKIGLGLDDEGRIAILLDASLNVSPLTFSLHDAGIGVSLNEQTEKESNPKIKLYISGFGVTFNNGVLSIGGGLSVVNTENGKTEYAGMLLINFKEIGLTAIGSYSAGSMWAYLVLSAPLGGIPAFFVKGLAAGFGYNRRLILPSIENVKEYPLVKAALNGSADANIIGELESNHYIEEENGQYFLAAGIKFTSFKIIDGFLLATVSFGNDCELGLLGLAEVSVPPNVGGNNSVKCLAKAQLAIKASVKPSDGVFSVEAQLTNESYILTKECKLTGGFAAYAWFGKNEHSGDFVVTLGGYHPSFVKPDHYPIVPRLGLNWQINKNISIIGEMYFAVTPSVLMAGGKLSATYTQGDLKAWFIAYADILMNWKPFTYDISMGVTLGASYTVNLLFVKKTFSVEMGADLHLWGPKLHGRIDVSWYIISFSIYFEEDGDDQIEKFETLDDFIGSFLAEELKPTKANKIEAVQNEPPKREFQNSDILTISFDGIVGKTSTTNNNETSLDIVSPYQLTISAISKIPTKANVRPIENSPELETSIRVVLERIENGKSEIIIDSDTEQGYKPENQKFKDISQNLPSALWGNGSQNLLNGNENTLVTGICGKKLSVKDLKNSPNLFPRKEGLWILLSMLYNQSITELEKCFVFLNDKELKPEEYQNTRPIFKSNETDAGKKEEVAENRKNFLKENNITEDISIAKFAGNADNLISEDFIII